MIEKLVSIIIPSYNMEDYIERNLNSLVNAKSLGLLDIIVVNDGSKDNTLKIARGYEQRFKGAVRVIDKPNGHYGTCINAALKMAEGKYFRILDADDWFDTDGLDRFVDEISRTDADLLVTLRVEISTGKNGETIKKHYPIKGVEYGKVYDATMFNISNYSENVEFNMHSMTYKTDILRQIKLNLPGGVCYTDMIYCMLPLDRIKTLQIFDIYLYHYVNDRVGSSTESSQVRRNFPHIVKVLTVMLGYLEEHPNNNPVVLDNQFRYVREAMHFLFASLKNQNKVSRNLYKDLSFIMRMLKKFNFDNRILHKFYFKYWVSTDRRMILNSSLWVYKFTHPFKVYPLQNIKERFIKY